MTQQGSEELTAQLEQANRQRNDAWRMWSYSKKNSILVLVGYHHPFEVTGFLVFKRTTVVHVYQWLHGAVFEFQDMPSPDHRPVPGSQKAVGAEKTIKIKTESGQYDITCQEVRFLPFPEGASL